MTASNTPTPELVERLLEPWDQRQSRRVQIEAEAATAIAKLTAERDAAKRDFQQAYEDWQKYSSLWMLMKQQAEAAEKRVKELEAKLKRITAIGEDNLEKLKSYIDATPAIEATNKLLSERTAVLEAGLQRLASPEAFTVPRMANEEEQARMHYADDVLRRAIASSEGK